MRARSREATQEGQDVGPLPPVVDQVRRDKAAYDFRFFCETYFAEAFPLAWSRDHLKVIAKIEDAVLRGSLTAYAMPRGSGKTTLSRIATIWAVINGHRKWAVLIGATEPAAKKLLNAIKKDLRWNALLLADYPEVCHPIAALEDEPRRCKGQTLDGRATLIEWTVNKIVLPTIAGSLSSGSIITVCGLTGNVRGQVDNRADGSVFRPDLVFLDDPQTKRSAKSAKQNTDRLELLNGDVLGLAGPTTAIAGLMACTVIYHGDMAATILDAKKSPEWPSELTKLVDAFPTNTEFWENYMRMREDDLGRGGDGSVATEYYRQNYEVMRAGADLPWPERFPGKFIDALEFAMVLRNRSPAVFAAEYQNEPIDEAGTDATISTADEIAAKVNGYGRRVVPSEATFLTSYIDVQGELLYWAVVAWTQHFTGYVIDYGSYPEQRRHYYTLRDATQTISLAHPGGLEARLYAALGKLTDKLLKNEFTQDGGNTMRIGKLLIDAGWGKSTKLIYQFCRMSPFASTLLPTHGRGVKATGCPLMNWPKKDGEQVGMNWRIRKTTENQAPIRHGIYDTNFWKSFIHARLSQKLGDKGCLSLFQAEPFEHQMLADQLTAERCIPTAAEGRRVDEWKLPPDKPDNHFLDVLTGCGVGASILGATLTLSEHELPRKPKRRRKLIVKF